MSNILSDALARYRMNTPTRDSKAQGTGELSALGQNPFDMQTLRYPLDGLGGNDVPHYMLFNINVSTGSKYVMNDADNAVSNTLSASTADLNYLEGLNPASKGGITDKPAAGTPGTVATIGAVAGAVSAGSIGGAIVGGAKEGVGGWIGATAAGTLNIRPQVKRIARSIALYMPDSQLTSQYEHAWDAKSLTEAMGLIGIASAFHGEISSMTNPHAIWQDIKNIGSEVKGLFTGSIYHNSQPGQDAEKAGIIGQKSGVAGQGFEDLVFRSSSRALNPQVQMVFTGTRNREFIFVFDFQPRSQQESKEIIQIIKTFKSFAAPEIANEGAGRYFIPPAQFDIKFYFKGQENPVIAKISTCALTSVTVNYNTSPPFTSFNDGMPVHIQLQLNFREMDIMVRELIDHFGY